MTPSPSLVSNRNKRSCQYASSYFRLEGGLIRIIKSRQAFLLPGALPRLVCHCSLVALCDQARYILSCNESQKVTQSRKEELGPRLRSSACRTEACPRSPCRPDTQGNGQSDSPVGLFPSLSTLGNFKFLPEVRGLTFYFSFLSIDFFTSF